MKKIIKVSLVALLVASPMVAKATPTALPAAYAGGATVPTEGDNEGIITAVTPNTQIATTSYVQGAYNQAAHYINLETARATGAENAIDSKVGSLAVLTADTTGNFDTAPASLAAAVNEAMGAAKAAAAGSDSAIGDLSSLDSSFSTAQKATVTAAINAVDSRVDTLESNVGNTALGTTDTGITTITGAIAELNGTDSTAGSVSYKVKNNAQNATFTANAANSASASLNSATTVTEAINNVATTVDTLKSTGVGTKANGNYITADSTVAQDLTTLDSKIKNNADAITSIESAQLAVYGSWGSDSATNVALFTLDTGAINSVTGPAQTVTH